MSKRFIDTEAHKVELRKADLKIRFTLDWLWKNCDAAGIWEVDADLFKFETGFDLDLEGLLKTCPWVKRLPTGPLFIPEFVTTNYGKLKEGYNPHKPVFRSLEAHGINPSTLQFQDLPKSSPRLEEEGKGEEEGKKLEKERARTIDDRREAFEAEVHEANEGSKFLPSVEVVKFIRYWTEPDRGYKPKMRFEKQSTWSTEGRLATWRDNYRSRQKPTATDHRKRTEPDRDEEVTLGKRLAS